MAQFSVVKEADAPRPARQSGRLAARMREFEGYVEGVKRAEVGKLMPARDETARGLALRISRAAKRKNRAIETWVVDNAVYFKVV